MSYPQESRINQQMDSQVKRILKQSIQHEQTKSSFISMMKLMQVFMMNPSNWEMESCEDYLSALKVYNEITGSNYVDRPVQEYVNNYYNVS